MTPSSPFGSRTRRTTISSPISLHSHSTGSISIRSRASVAATSRAASVAASSTSENASSAGDTIRPDQLPRFLTPGLSTPTWPAEQGTYSLSCSTTIHAPLQLVLALVLDTRTYTRWNTFSPRVKVTHQPRSTAPLPACLRGSPAIEAIANLAGTLRDGTSFVMDVCMDPKSHPRRSTTPGLKVSRLEQFTREDGRDDGGTGGNGGGRRVGVRLAWRIRGMVAELLARSERVHEFVFDPRNPNVTEVVCWETYYGVLASGMRHLYGKQIKEGYIGWMNGLKCCSEAEWNKQTSPAPATAMRATKSMTMMTPPPPDFIK